jgi:ADP-ribose pyrophosphatase
MQETITDTRKIFKGRVVRLNVHEVRLPNGQFSRREIIHHSGAVAVIALDDEQNVLLVRQFRLGANAVLLEIPAGVLEADEAPPICAERELQEEAGYKPGRLEPLGGFFAAPGYSTEYIHLFLACDLTESRLTGDTDEFVEMQRVPFAEALAMVERGDIVDAKTIIGLLRTRTHLNTAPCS